MLPFVKAALNGSLGGIGCASSNSHSSGATGMRTLQLVCLYSELPIEVISREILSGTNFFLCKQATTHN